MALVAVVAGLGACEQARSPFGAEPTPSFIVNGEPTGEASFTNVGALLFDFDRNAVVNGDDALCSGSLISPTVFLTAAHCVWFFEPGA